MAMRTGLAVAAMTAALGGCVTTGTYDEAVAQSNSYQAKLRKCDAQRFKLEKDGKEQEKEHEKAAAVAQTKLRELEIEKRNLQAKVDESVETQEEMRAELSRLGKDFVKERRSYAEARAHLAELRRLEDKAKTRSALRDELRRKLLRMIEGGQLKVVTRDNQFAVVVPSDALFDAGKTEIKNSGKFLLLELAHALTAFEGRRFIVAVHTDSAPTKSTRFPTGADLAAARASAIVALFSKNDLPSARLMGVGVGDSVPWSASASAAENRRVEVSFELTADEVLPMTDDPPVAVPGGQ
jgi:flagellar motor protein MotB